MPAHGALLTTCTDSQNRGTGLILGKWGNTGGIHPQSTPFEGDCGTGRAPRRGPAPATAARPPTEEPSEHFRHRDNAPPPPPPLAEPSRGYGAQQRGARHAPFMRTGELPPHGGQYRWSSLPSGLWVVPYAGWNPPMLVGDALCRAEPP